MPNKSWHSARKGCQFRYNHSGRDDHALSLQFLSSLLAHKSRHLLISNLATDTGMAFVLVQHLDPEPHSMLTELFSKKTTMRVKEVINGMSVEPNHVYVIPPNATMSISNHTLQLGPRGESPPPEMTHSASVFCPSLRLCRESFSCSTTLAISPCSLYCRRRHLLLTGENP